MAVAENSSKYLIVGPSWIGDMVMAQSLFIDIKNREPDAVIDVLVPKWTAGLIERMPQVRNLISAGFEHGKLTLGERFRLGRELRSHSYTNSIVLPNSFKSGLVPLIAGIPIRTGYVGEQRWGMLNDIRRLDKEALPMTVQRFVALGEPKDAAARTVKSIPVPKLQADDKGIERALNNNILNTDGRVLVLCPGAEFGASKKWPASKFAAIAQRYLARNWQVWLMGSDKDMQDCVEIDHLCGGKCRQLAGHTTLPEAIDLISCASLAVTNDSGLMHIAAALRIPLVALFGSTDPGHTPPLSRNFIAARVGLDCSPCFQRECPLQHHDCMNKLSTSHVLACTKKVLNLSAE